MFFNYENTVYIGTHQIHIIWKYVEQVAGLYHISVCMMCSIHDRLLTVNIN